MLLYNVPNYKKYKYLKNIHRVERRL